MPKTEFSLRVFWVGMFCAVTVLGCAKYKRQIASQQDEIDSLADQNAALEKENTDLKATVQSLEAQKAETEKAGEELAAAKAELETTVAGLQARIEEMELELEGKEKLTTEQKSLLQDLKKKQAQAKQRLDTLKRLLKQFKSLIASGKLKVQVHRNMLMLAMPDAVLFESGKADLTEDGQKTLTQVAKVLAGIRRREFQVAGHTDSVPIKSANFASNWELSTQRAVEVVKFLAKNKVRSSVLSAAGYAKFKPVATNKTDNGKAQNRRIEIVLMPNLDELPDLKLLEKEIKK